MSCAIPQSLTAFLSCFSSSKIILKLWGQMTILCPVLLLSTSMTPKRSTTSPTSVLGYNSTEHYIIFQCGSGTVSCNPFLGLFLSVDGATLQCSYKTALLILPIIELYNMLLECLANLPSAYLTQ